MENYGWDKIEVRGLFEDKGKILDKKIEEMWDNITVRGIFENYLAEEKNYKRK